LKSFSLADARAVASLLDAAARTEIMPRFRRLADCDIRAKNGPLDIVTEADEAAERAISAWLAEAFPGCVVVGEEAASADPALLDALGEAELAFVVDPIDGTSNYAAGLPLFATMAAAIRHGEIVAAVIHDPVSRDTAFALRGEGAWTEQPDGMRHDLRVAAPAEVGAMTGAASWRFLPDPQRTIVSRNLGRVAGSFSYRCAAHEYRMLAGGHLHFLLYGKLMPWDHAPGWLLHREAGGYSGMFDASPYRATIHKGGLLLAPDEASFLALRAALLEH
jgi:fructose-1,6-bisphosphatase/inositol monophosphatase family enzyme